MKIFSHHGKVKAVVEVAALEIRPDAPDMAFRLDGSYAPLQAEQQKKNAVSVIVWVCQDHPESFHLPSVIEVAPSADVAKTTTPGNRSIKGEV